MTQNNVYRLTVKASEKELHVQHTEVSSRQKPFTTDQLDTPVHQAIIGYWVDIMGRDCEVLYRKFLNYLPLNLPDCWSQWGIRKQQRASYIIELPALPNATCIKLYEQRLTAPGRRRTQRQQHFQLNIAELAG